MAIQFSTEYRNNILDEIETVAGTSAVLKIRTGAQPATCATADAGTVLATLTLPNDWMAAASSGSKAKNGTWEDTSADANGTAAHFRLYKTNGTTCIMQGSVGQGSGDLSVDNTDFASGQQFTVTGFTLTAPGA